jgi:formylglycine-generating enzyme required for sulfatase activity/energy-coupling factor transporter ATP-binding protein EcfA2
MSDLDTRIAQIEAIRATIGDDAADAAIAALHATAVPPASDTTTSDTDAQQTPPDTTEPPASPPAPPQPAGDHLQSNVTLDDSTLHGAATGINQGTINIFFSGQTTTATEDGKHLLAAYLDSLNNEYQQLRLSRLTGKRQSGKEQQTAPPLRLQAVYTTLAVDQSQTLPNEQMTVATLKQTLQEHHPQQVPPEQVRLLADIPAGIEQELRKQTGAAAPHAGMDLQRLIGDLPDKHRLEVQFTRPRLAVEAIASIRRLVLLGEPGAGKSTVLRYLALLLAQRIRQQTATIPGWPDDHLPVPILVPLGAVADRLKQQADGDAGRALWQVLGDVLDGEQAIRAGLRDYLKPAIRNGGVLLLFDGLDELPTSGDNPRAQVAHALCRFACSDAAKTPLVVTSRVLPYYTQSDWQLPADEEWQVRTIQPLAFGQVRQFVQLWYTELASRDEEISTTEATSRADALITALEGHPRLQPLIRSPLLLTMLAILHGNKNELPDDRVVLYEESVQLLLERWEPERTILMQVRHQGLLERLAPPTLRLEQIREQLHQLALQVHTRPPGDDGRGALNRYELTGRMLDFFTNMRCDDPAAKVAIFIQALNEEAGLLVARGDDAYAFPHLTFQEYLAACGLADLDDMVDQAYACWSSSDADRWREVLLLFIGRLRQRGSLSIKRDALAWLERLLAKKNGRHPKPTAQRHRDTVLAALSYRELGAETTLNNLTNIDIETDIEQPLRTAILELLAERDSGIVVADRVAAAHVLGTLGDPRLLDPTTGDSPTGDYWCHVAAGTFWFGDDRKEELRQMHLDYPFNIGRYPVTNAEFARFIAANGNDGYDPAQPWWSEHARAYLPAGGHDYPWENNEQPITLPRFWHDTRFNNPSQPVVGISWYEGAAYCAWLTAQGHTHGWLPEDEEIRLPTSLEWERAARHTDQRPYPWGSAEPTREHANFGRTGIGTTAPVGCFPRGAAVCGALDMAGNVMEWMATSNDAPAEQSPRRDFAHRDGVLRSYSEWTDDSLEQMFCGSRGGDDAINWYNDFGVRLLRPLAHPNNSSDF